MSITAEEGYATLVNALAILPGVTRWEKKRFGSPGLTIHGKGFAMLVKGRLAVKLPKARVDELIEGRIGESFELGQKRMKEWITLDPTSHLLTRGSIPGRKPRSLWRLLPRLMMEGASPRYDSPTPPHSTGRLLTSDFSQARATDL